MIRPKTIIYWVRKPAKRFEKGEAREIFPKTAAETGRTERKATVLTENASAKYFTKDFSSALRCLTINSLRCGAKMKIAPQEKTDIRKPESQAAKGSKRRTVTIAIPRFSIGFEPEKKIFER